MLNPRLPRRIFWILDHLGDEIIGDFLRLLGSWTLRWGDVNKRPIITVLVAWLIAGGVGLYLQTIFQPAWWLNLIVVFVTSVLGYPFTDTWGHVDDNLTRIDLRRSVILSVFLGICMGFIF
jgi:uncharacterized membrane protein YfcA